MFVFLAFLGTLLSLTACAPLQGTPQETRSRNKLLLVSFDGFRWNYDQDVDTPNLEAMARDGVKARYLTPPFVTQTSPSHYTLLTENRSMFHHVNLRHVCIETLAI
uniref:Ectonucleotide pyrophosphatase/phosphodiesterase 7 n=1 Tax=Pseudonaja textilis TaxID=8673 RepID=A0A670Y502_PSETE